MMKGGHGSTNNMTLTGVYSTMHLVHPNYCHVTAICMCVCVCVWVCVGVCVCVCVCVVCERRGEREREYIHMCTTPAHTHRFQN